jgi:hypothetical protein
MSGDPIVTLLHKVMLDVTSIGKKDFNDFHKFSFRGIDTVIENVGPSFRTHGIVVMPEVRHIDSIELTSKDGKRKRSVTLTVAYTFHGPAGDSITAVVPGEANDTEDKATSKAMSVAFRTALLQVLSVPTNERDPHAGPIVSTKLAKLREEAKQIAAAREWEFARLADEYFQWSQGAEIAAADEKDMEAFVKTLRPTQTVQRQRGQS